VYTNAGDAKIKGAELEIQSVLPGGLHLNAAASYIDAYYTYVNPNANIPETILPNGENECPATAPGICAINPPGLTQLDAKLPKTPKYKLTFDPEYDYALANDATIRLITAFTYTAEMWNDSLNTPELRRPATRDLSASLHYVSPDDTYDVAIGATNLTDDRYVTAGSPNAAAGEVGGYF